jgi:hypothetical protein
MSLEKIYIIDDGSIASQLLQHEYKDKYDVKTIEVNPGLSLLESFTKVGQDRKTHLHLPHEVLSSNHEQYRKEIRKLELMGYKNLIVLPYEGLDWKTLTERARKAGITKVQDRQNKNKVIVEDETDKPYKTIRTRKKL